MSASTQKKNQCTVTSASLLRRRAFISCRDLVDLDGGLGMCTVAALEVHRNLKSEFAFNSRQCIQILLRHWTVLHVFLPKKIQHEGLLFRHTCDLYIRSRSLTLQYEGMKLSGGYQHAHTLSEWKKQQQPMLTVFDTSGFMNTDHYTETHDFSCHWKMKSKMQKPLKHQHPPPSPPVHHQLQQQQPQQRTHLILATISLCLACSKRDLSSNTWRCCCCCCSRASDSRNRSRNAVCSILIWCSWKRDATSSRFKSVWRGVMCFSRWNQQTNQIVWILGFSFFFFTLRTDSFVMPVGSSQLTMDDWVQMTL